MGVVTLFGFSCLAFGIIMLKLHFIHQRLDNIMEYIASYEKRYMFYRDMDNRERETSENQSKHDISWLTTNILFKPDWKVARGKQIVDVKSEIIAGFNRTIERIDSSMKAKNFTETKK